MKPRATRGGYAGSSSGQAPKRPTSAGASENPPVEAPVRLCCHQRHYGPVCTDGKVMCCLCFHRFDITQLNEVDETREDVVMSVHKGKPDYDRRIETILEVIKSSCTNPCCWDPSDGETEYDDLTSRERIRQAIIEAFPYLSSPTV